MPKRKRPDPTNRQGFQAVANKTAQDINDIINNERGKLDIPETETFDAYVDPQIAGGLARGHALERDPTLSPKNVQTDRAAHYTLKKLPSKINKMSDGRNRLIYGKPEPKS